ncbi:TadE/TadG family type IV pilus assembly protein [Phenylobacterium sp.]|uniref:TadE/TadG family type IV pilus assembly protein n=1 Tax=Phenylobacterium sp. TaxID=1871053 RepID=UPI002DF45FC3|nr:TadE/TadG family type IV pilus assembly protein [Phenylobacterium sp.]
MSLRRLLRSEDGAAMVEFAFVLPMFLVMMAGLFDGARLINTSLQVQASAQAGAAYAAIHGFDSAGIQTAVAQATPLGAQATPAPTEFVGCLVGKPIGQGDKCTGDNPLGSYVTVTAQASFTPLAPWPGLLWPNALTAQAMVRIS